MEERIIVKATASAQPFEKKSNDTKKNSLMGVLLPLTVPICIMIYMLMEEIKFRNLDGYLKVLFLGGLAFSAILFVLHQKAVQIENDKIEEAERIAVNQSLIVTDQRIYGNIRYRSFSYDYSKIIKAYSTQTIGNQAKLIVKLCDSSNLEFQYIANLHTVISCINDAKMNYDREISVPVMNQDGVTDTVIKADINVVYSNEPTPNIEKDSKQEILQDGVVDTVSTKAKVDLYNVVISSANGSMAQIKVIREITLLALAPAKAIFSSLPYTIAESQELSAAKDLQYKLEHTGMHVYLVKVSSDL